MNLRDFIKTLSPDEQEVFAIGCETSVGQLKQVAGDHRRASVSLAINIERESDGAIRCEELRPDVDWDYIRGTSKAS